MGVKRGLEFFVLVLFLISFTSALSCGTYSYSSPVNASVNSEYSPSYSASKAIDGNINTRWYGKSTGYPKFISLDLGIKKCINSINLTIYSYDVPINFSLEVSDDAVNWVVVQSRLILNTNSSIFNFAEISGRYIRVYETSGKRNYGTLSEVKVNSANISGENCIPKTCSQLGKTCGSVSDGCGGSLNCGTCDSGSSCVNGGCIASAVCRNNITEAGEVCDNEPYSILDMKINGKNCSSFGFDLGDIRCSQDCNSYLLGDCRKIIYFNCTDLDGGIDIFNKSLLSSVNSKATFGSNSTGLKNSTGGVGQSHGPEYCLNSTTLNEYFCDVSIINSGQNPLISKSYFCSNGCLNGACVQPTCNDSDGGLNYGVKGNVTGVEVNESGDLVKGGDGSYDYATEYDLCTNNYINEYSCRSDGGLNVSEYDCSSEGKVCNDGACIEEPQICSSLINKIKNPTNDGNRRLSWNYISLGETTWINDKEEKYNQYSAVWEWNSQEYNENQLNYYNIQYELQVFDNKDINLSEYASWNKQDPACKLNSYWLNGKEENYFICNWDALENNQDNGNYKGNNRQIFWYNKNVVIRIYLYYGEELTDAEVTKLSQQRINDLINSLANNQYKYIDWSNFNIEYPAVEELSNTLEECGSEVQSDNQNNLDWECKTEPAVCPPHGYQTRTCKAWNSQIRKYDTQTSQLDCSPGICSGCYVPKWFSKNWINDNKCIPYGFRFEQQSKDFTEMIVEREDIEDIEETQESNSLLKVLSENKAILTFYGEQENLTYILIPEETILIKVPGEVTEYQVTTKSIFFSTAENIQSYVTLSIKYSYMQRVYDEINQYCDIDGQIKVQKIVDSQGEWAECQNNYECESNVCSSGECIEVQSMMNKVKGFKGAFFKLICKIGNPISKDDYNQCVFNFVGIYPEEPEIPGRVIDLTSEIVDGDSVLLSKASDNINLGDNLGVYTGTIDNEDLQGTLKKGFLTNSKGIQFNYEQGIKIGTPQFQHFRDSDYEDLVGLSEKTPVLGFKISPNIWIMNYTLDFTTDAESILGLGNRMIDIEGSSINLLGKKYYISDFANGTSAIRLAGKLTLLESNGIVNIKEGEKVKVKTNKKSYDVSIDFLSTSEVRLKVNGITTNALSEGESYRLSDSSYIFIKDILSKDVAGSIGQVDFVIGLNKLEIISKSEIKLNDETIDGVYGWIYKGTASGSTERLDKIVIEWKADDEMFLTPKLELKMPLFDTIKFVMGDVVRSTEEKTTIESDGANSIKMNVSIKDGNVDINVFSNNITGIPKLASVSSYNISRITFKEKDYRGNDYNSYFVVSYNTTTEAESYLLRARTSYDSTILREEVAIDKYANGGWVAVCEGKINGSDCNIGNVVFIIHDLNYSYEKDVTLFAGNNVNFNTIFTKEGLKIILPYLYDRSGIIRFVEEDKDDNIGFGKKFNITLGDNSFNEIQVSKINDAGSGSALGLEMDESNTYELYLNGSAVASRILHYTAPDQDYAEIYYPGGETYAQVYLTGKYQI